MRQVVWLRRATRSLSSILEQISEGSPQATKGLGLAIQKHVALLREQPHMGRPGRVLGTRELVVHKNYLVPYRIRDERIEILHVLHSRQQWPSTLDPENK